MDLFLAMIIWLFMLVVLFSGYFKLSNKEKKELKEELKRPVVIFTVVFRILGYLFFFTGLIYRDFFKGIGIALLAIALFVTGIEIYDSKRKTSKLIIAVAIIVPFIYFGHYLWDIMV